MTLTLEERERAAYMRGDIELAAALAAEDDELISLQAELDDLEKQLDRAHDLLGQD